MNDPYRLQRFVEAQDPVFEQVLRELAAGEKETHWMWFVFPQIEGLGQSETARKYSIRSREEARAYLDHPVLGPRLLQCTRLVAGVEGRSAERIFGHPDNLKLRSCMTLFGAVASEDQVFGDVLQKYFGGEADALTLERLRGLPPGGP